MRLLVTGGAGFFGVHIVTELLKGQDVVSVTVLDCCTHTAVPQALPASSRLRLVRGTVHDAGLLADLLRDCDAVIHLAAETFVDASIADDQSFINTNVHGTAVLLRALRHLPGRRLVHVSTDEVFGEALSEPFTETSPYAPRSPYAATKAAADHLVRAYTITHGVDAVICHCCNLFGRWQYPEKLIPVTVARLLRGQKARIYGTGKQSRSWLHVSDGAAGLVATLNRGRTGESYLIGSQDERTTLEIVGRIAELMGVPVEDAISFVSDRLGHDSRYAMDTVKARTDLGWTPRTTLDAGLEDTVAWMIDNDGWWGNDAV